MTMRLDLRTLPSGLRRTFLRPDLFGCADCGQWFQFATGKYGLVAHIPVCPARTEARDAH